MIITILAWEDSKGVKYSAYIFILFIIFGDVLLLFSFYLFEAGSC